MDFGEKVVEWVCEAVAAVLVGGGMGWLGANMRVDEKMQKQKAELLRTIADSTAASEARVVAELERLAAELRDDLRRLEKDLGDLEQHDVDHRVQSASDHTEAAGIARSLSEVRDQCQRTNDTLNRVLGLLQGQGIKL